ncbi:hypothetical protein EXS62_00085 [Candidatus Kaiserbacteria bacterium]|nr:hypothetical protein [Candidatus Kaiserbacteria bacterium]
MQLFIPAILVAAAIGLFSTYINPAYQATKVLQTQVSAFEDALGKARDLKSERDKIGKIYNTISPDDLQKIEHMLPDNVDNIRLIIDINGIAAGRGLTLKNVALGTLSDSKAARSASAVGASGDATGSVSVGFSVTTTYENFLLFLADLEHSLRILDVEKVSLKPSGTSNYDMSVTLRTYWLH